MSESYSLCGQCGAYWECGCTWKGRPAERLLHNPTLADLIKIEPWTEPPPGTFVFEAAPGSVSPEPQVVYGPVKVRDDGPGFSNDWYNPIWPEYRVKAGDDATLHITVAGYEEV